jgi:hypothetical protein
MESRGISPVWVIVGIAVFALVLCSVAVYQAYFAPSPPAPPVTTFTKVVLSVNDAVTGEGVPNATVILRGPTPKTGTTDSSGAVEFDFVSSGTYTIDYWAENYYSARVTRELKGTEQLLVVTPGLPLKPAAVEASLSLSAMTIVDNNDNRPWDITATVGIPANKLLLGPILEVSVAEESQILVNSLSVVSGGTLTETKENFWKISMGPEIRENTTVSFRAILGTKGMPVGSTLTLSVVLKDTAPTSPKPLAPERDNNLVSDVTQTVSITVAGWG